MAKSKAELEKEAKKLGLEIFEDETVLELKKRIAEAKEDSDADKKGKGGTTIAHVSRNGEVIRTYTKEEHGDDFLEHAQSFASKEEGRTIETE